MLSSEAERFVASHHKKDQEERGLADWLRTETERIEKLPANLKKESTEGRAGRERDPAKAPFGV